jgi:hypothetical protein
VEVMLETITAPFIGVALYGNNDSAFFTKYYATYSELKASNKSKMLIGIVSQ